MFYDRRRKEILFSITEASLKVEGDWHFREINIMDLKVCAQVETVLSFLLYTIIIKYTTCIIGERAVSCGINRCKDPIQCGSTLFCVLVQLNPTTYLTA